MARAATCAGGGGAPAADTNPSASPRAPPDARTPKKRAREGPAPFRNAYLHFSRARRAEVAAARAGWSVQQVSAEVGRLWKALAPTERRPWVELAQFDKARFQSEEAERRAAAASDSPAAAWASAADEAGAEARRPAPAKRRRKRPGEPRQPDTAYTFFWKSRRAQVVAAHPQLPAPLVSREVGRQWKALADDDRQVWKALAEQDQRRFQHEMAQYSPPPEDAPASLLPAPLKDPYAPAPARTGFQLFMNHHRESLALLQMSLNEFRAEMGRVWRQLGDAGRAEWLARARRDRQRYEAELQAYKPPAYLSLPAARAARRLDELKKAARGDADAPKLPASAYSFFLSAARRNIQAQRPGIKHNEVMREVGAAWKALGDADRQPFRAQAEADVARFEREMELHTVRSQKERLGLTASGARAAARRGVAAADGAATPPRLKRSGNGRKLLPPRRPQTAYNIMYMSKRAEVLATYQVSHNECSALCGRLWRQMTDAEREPFRRMADEDKLRYAAQLREYRARLEAGDRAGGAEGSLGFLCFAAAKRRESHGLTQQDLEAAWATLSEQHQVLWQELASDRAHEQAGGEAWHRRQQQQQEEEQRQLEENARAILAAREMRFSFDESDELDGDAHALPASAALSTGDEDEQRERLGELEAMEYPPHAYAGSHDEHGGGFGGADRYQRALEQDRHQRTFEDDGGGGGSSSDGAEDESEADSGRESLDADAICDLLPAAAGPGHLEVDAFV